MPKWLDTFASVLGRPRAIEQGEQMVVSDGLMASAVRPDKGGVYFLPVDEIIRRSGWRTYNEMLHDDEVKQALWFKKILVVGRKYQFAPKDASNAQQKEAADFIQACFDRVDLKHALFEAVTAFEYGYSLAEIVFKRDLYDGTPRVMLQKIAHRDPRELYLQIDTHGNYTGVQQNAMGVITTLPPQQTWLYTYNKRFGNIYGVSDLRSAYRSWWAKKFIINFWNVFLERMGSPMMLMKYPQGATNELKQLLKKILSTLASNTEVLVPEGVEVDLIEAQRSGNATYNDALNFHNNAISRSLLVGQLFGTGAETASNRGSDSQSLIQAHLIFKMAELLSDEVADSLMCQVVKQLLALNYGDDQVDALMPLFVWQDYGEYQATLIADEIRQLHAAGIIDMDQTDVNYIRGLLGMKLRDENNPDEVLRPAALPLTGEGAAQPPAAGQGNKRADKGGSAKTKDSTVEK